MESIISIVIGAVIIAIGIMNRKGNVSMLHSYHKKRVSEEDIIPFGKMVGLGMLIIGAALIVMGVLTFLADYSEKNIYSRFGSVALVAGLVVGLGISFYAMIKYNKGIF